MNAEIVARLERSFDQLGYMAASLDNAADNLSMSEVAELLDFVRLLKERYSER